MCDSRHIIFIWLKCILRVIKCYLLLSFFLSIFASQNNQKREFMYFQRQSGRIVQFKNILLLKNKMEQSTQLAQVKKARVMAALLLVLEIGIMFAYGFGTKIDTSLAIAGTDNSMYLMVYLGASFFAIVGWGLIIGYSENSAVSGLSITLMVIGLTVQLQPLVNAFWKYCFTTFNGVFTVNLYSLCLSMFVCASMLVAFCFLSGRVSIVETFTVIIIFNFGWALNSNLVTYLFTNKWTNEVQITDANGTNYIYVFGCVFALVVSIILNFKLGAKPNTTGSRHSAFIGMIGTGFTFAAFPFTGISYATIIGGYENPMNIYFALTASVIMTYWSSTAFGGFKTGVRESLVGILGGGVMISVVSPYINNIGGCIAIGAFAGIVSGIWLRHGYPKMNQNKPHDPLGLTGPILINAVIGGFAVGPLLMVAYRTLGLSLVELNASVKITQRTSTFYLTIFGVTVGIAAGMGLIAGLICYFTRDPTNDFQFQKLISKEFGLYNEQEERRAENNQPPPAESVGQLRNQDI